MDRIVLATSYDAIKLNKRGLKMRLESVSGLVSNIW